MVTRNEHYGRILKSQFFVGLDLGQSCDPTAICVVERAELVGWWDGGVLAFPREVELRLRHLERVELGTTYPEIVQKVRGMAQSDAMRGRCCVVVDATGVGVPVVDYFREAGLGRAEDLVPVMVTGGQTQHSDRGFEYVPKRDLIVGLELLFEDDTLKITSELNYLEALKKEMAAVRVKVTPAGNEQFGAWRTGEHDDLVFSVALACWAVQKQFPGKLKGEDGYWQMREPWKIWGGGGVFGEEGSCGMSKSEQLHRMLF